ncbi:Zn-dependent hydrolase [Methylocella tundrae]|uniref:Putative hydrolase MSMEG_3995/MSMEI_3903 n=1 Tax=Methylocella tundrae TaxID=227605 RepID=A0A4U8YZN9_METTU|nr:Zn-dependent hydrolase [Methylocella tundrae]WPP06121.1 Zn-dependent hydrolase [Methylocella tundrae]VFU08735.1 putative hydrolase MSMEG_3995/MSMEI_3903 [Methylocella tundrae]
MFETKSETAATPIINAGDLHHLMDEVSAIGGGPDGSMNRLSLSPEDAAARDWLVSFLQSEGLKVAVDRIGNIFGILDWAGPDAPTVMTGSHLDSQPNGGRFDGAYGVVAACAAVRTIKREVAESGLKPKANFIIVNWTNEEGARFQPSLLGSAVYAGEIDAAYALARRDGSGVSVGEALDAIQYLGEAAPKIPDAYIELHIEGAASLENAGLRFGVFSRYWGAVKYRLAFLGRQAHTGPTPMAERRDALLAAAHLITELKGMADRAGLELHTSVGRLEVFPNSPNVVPNEAVLFIELRSGSPEVLAAAERELELKISQSAERAGVMFEVRSIDRRKAGLMDEGLVRLAQNTARDFDEKALLLDTIGGHDAISMTAVCPSVVIAVPSVGGVMHHPSEFTSEPDRALGAQILAGMLWRFCVNGDVLAA